MPKSETGISTLNRVFSILNAFSEDQQVLTLTEISRRAGLPKSTTHRFLEALEKHGMISQHPYLSGYQLGYQMVRWGTLALSSLNLRQTAMPVLQDLVAETNETAVLSVRYGNFGLWAEVVESPQPVRLAMRIGKPLNLHAGASSKVLLAFLPEKEIERILGEIELAPIRPATITDLCKMRAELEKIRSLRYAVSYEETDAGAMGIAAPVYDHAGQLAAGIGIVAPITRIPPEKVADYAWQVVEAGHELSKRLGSPVLEPSI